MSRWLSSVNTLLERLDDQAQDYVEETINTAVQGGRRDEDGEVDDNLESILAQRGLDVNTSHEEEDNENDEVVAMDEEAGNHSAGGWADDLSFPDDSEKAATADESPGVSEAKNGEVSASKQPESQASNDMEERQKLATSTDETEPKDDSAAEEEAAATEKPNSDEIAEAANCEENLATDEKGSERDNSETSPTDTSIAADKPYSTVEAAPPPLPPKQVKPPAPQPPQPIKASVSSPVNNYPAVLKEAREAQKEVRTLRRHVVNLNKQLEVAEAEVEAQRKELEQAATRMEKDRAKSKADREAERKRQAEELTAIQTQHEQMLVDQKTRYEQQLKDMAQKIRDMDNKRMQEGGNWDKELSEAVEREQELVQKNAALEDEKATLLAQIHTLSSQQEALGDRLESLTQTADSAMEREREAEERLDQALSVHAHQISQRQARESELERTIAEMGYEIAALRNQESSRISDYKKEGSDMTGENTSQDSSLRVRLDTALHDLETAHANLDLEKQRTAALKKELRDISSERTEDATNTRMRQNQFDRKVAELTHQISQLKERAVEESDNDPGVRDSMNARTSRDDGDIHEMKNQIKALSEEILKSRDKAGHYSSEVSTLRSRLSAAIDRADKAEAALEETMIAHASDNSYDRMERAAPVSGNTMRKRGVNRQRSGASSIRSAMQLNEQQRVGKVVDVLDSFSVSTGKYLRVNPFARAAFIVYLMILHLWTFVIIFFHAHNFEDIHRDFGSHGHGPEAIMKQQLGGAAGKVAAAAAAAAGGVSKPNP